MPGRGKKGQLRKKMRASQTYEVLHMLNPFYLFTHRFHWRDGRKQPGSWTATCNSMSGRRLMKTLSTIGNLSESWSVRYEIYVRRKMPEGALEYWRLAYDPTLRQLSLLGWFSSRFLYASANIYFPNTGSTVRHGLFYLYHWTPTNQVHRPS